MVEMRYPVIKLLDWRARDAELAASMNPFAVVVRAHLAAALVVADVRRLRGLPTLTFVSADNSQRQAAAAEGLRVEDPNAHS